MGDNQGLAIKVSADVKDAIYSLQQFESALTSAEKELRAIGFAIDNAIASGKDFSKLEDEYQAVSNKVKDLKANIDRLSAPQPPIKPPIVPPVPVPDDSGLLNSVSKQRTAFLDLGRVVTGQGFNLRSLASNFTLFGPAITIAAAAVYGLVELFLKQSDAEKKAADDAKKLKDELIDLKSANTVTEEATGSEAGNIARIQALAAAITDTTKSYKERKNALDELRETNKAYFGDLTLETDSLKKLSSRVSEYSNALITEAIVKGQVEAIAKTSEELQRQKKILDDVRDAYNKASEAAKNNSTTGPTLTVGGGQSSFSQSDFYNQQLTKATDNLTKQKEAVYKLEDQIVDYKRSLDDAIGDQIKQKPLTIAPPPKDELKSVIPILEQIQKIYAEIAKPSKDPIFQQVKQAQDALNQDSTLYKLFQAKIAEAYRNAIKDPANADAYNDLAKALQAQLVHTQNPDLHSQIRFTLADPTKDEVDKAQAAIDRTFGKQIHLKLTPDLELQIEQLGLSSEASAQLKKALEHQLQQNIPVINLQVEAIPDIRKQRLEDATKKLKSDLEKQINTAEVSGLSSLGESIGSAIGSGKDPIEAAGKSILSSLGSLIEDIGKSLIEYGVVKEGLDTVLQGGIAIPGVVAIGLGIAAEAVGALVKSAGGSYKPMAAGGIVTGPQYALIGEAGPEVVAPLDKLSNFIKGSRSSGQDVNVTGSFKIAGNDLVVAIQRANKNAKLV